MIRISSAQNNTTTITLNKCHLYLVGEVSEYWSLTYAGMKICLVGSTSKHLHMQGSSLKIAVREIWLVPNIPFTVILQRIIEGQYSTSRKIRGIAGRFNVRGGGSTMSAIQSRSRGSCMVWRWSESTKTGNKIDAYTSRQKNQHNSNHQRCHASVLSPVRRHRRK